MCAGVAVLGLLLPMLERESRSRQLMSKVVQVTMALFVCFASLLILFLVVILRASWEKGRWRGTLGKGGKMSHCPRTIGQILTHLLFPMLKSGKSSALGDGWSHSRTRTAARCACAGTSTAIHLCDCLPGVTFPV